MEGGILGLIPGLHLDMGEGFAVLCCQHYMGNTLVRGRLHTAGRLLRGEVGLESQSTCLVLSS